MCKGVKNYLKILIYYFNIYENFLYWKLARKYI